MPVEPNYAARIAQFKWDDLSALWRSIQAGATPGWELGRAFEYLVLRAFQLEDAEVVWPFRVKIQSEVVEQIDGIIYIDSLAFLVESKDQSEEINFEPIAKLRSQLARRPPSVMGVVFSRKGFTNPALTLTRTLSPQNVLLWSGDEIDFALEHEYFRKGLLEKYRFCVEHGRPDFNIRVGELK